jgi:putative transcriptional regulator
MLLNGGIKMIKYYKLFDLLNRREMKKTDLLQIISSPTLAKLSKGDVIKTDIIDKICQFLECQPGDIMEYITISSHEDLRTEEVKTESIEQTKKEAWEKEKETLKNSKTQSLSKTMKQSFENGMNFGKAKK